ncbi:hypothetical protein [Sphingomonas sp.]|uniref:hypothetical protein n=1 Tax=Sphingomonas sp. TaxID=28214 RepID=UPI0031D9C4B5
MILTGMAADICGLFTAADAHIRQYGLWVRGDTVARGAGDHAARHLRGNAGDGDVIAL